MRRLTAVQEKTIERFAKALIDEQNRRVLIPPMGDHEGFWFGGGSVVEGADGRLCLSGRYRNPGDSRHGVGKGERGLELAVFESRDRGASFQKLLSFSKKDLSRDGAEVISIEGSSLLLLDGRVELYVSTEKNGRNYPSELSSFQKPGTGIWSIDLLSAPRFEDLKSAQVEKVVASDEPTRLHVKDPVVLPMANGDTYLFYCTHPFSWSSTNSALAIRPAGASRFGASRHDLLDRGAAWDVAISRITGFLELPLVGIFRNGPPVTLVFYDGGECLRNHSAHPMGVERPRGYSCEELGGLGYVVDQDFSEVIRLSETAPYFVSPWGTGASRYASALLTAESVWAFWEQSQQSGAQPLVSNTLEMGRVEELLSANGG